MAELFEPWITYPSLTEDRLRVVATLIRDARDGAVTLHDEEAGDSFWSLGCRAYSRTLSVLRKASLVHAWLRILPEVEALRFTFTIGTMPIKFYKGLAEEAPANTLARSDAELAQQELVFGSEGAKIEDRILRLAVQTTAIGKTSKILLVEMDSSGHVLNVYEIPFEATSNIAILETKPVDLGPPTLQRISKTKKNENIAKGSGEKHAVGSEA